MSRAVYIFLLAVLLALPNVTASSSSITDEDRLRITLSYPAEVKAGTCFTLTLHTTFLGSLDVSLLRLTVVYVAGSTSTNLLVDNVIPTLTSYVSGNVISKTYNICVPSTTLVSPVITATVFANYTRAPSTFKTLTHSWQLAVVRDRTYSEVLTSLAQAESHINTLRQTIDELRARINTLSDQLERTRAQLERAVRESTELSVRLDEARREIRRLEERYSNLSAEYRALSDRYVGVVGDLRSLEALHRALQSEHAALSENYRQLLNDYRSLTNDYTALQSRFTQLQGLYQDLSTRHEDARRQIGFLQSQLDETRQSLQNLLQQYTILTGENALHRNIAYAEAFALVAVMSALASFAVTRRRKTSIQTTPALPPPPPPNPSQQEPSKNTQ